MASSVYRQRLLLQLLSKRSRRSTEGFTLVEVLVVIVIIGALAAIGWPAYINQLQRANYNSASIDALSQAKACVAANAAGGPACAPAYTATAGTGTNARTVTVTVAADGAITPAPPFTP